MKKKYAFTLAETLLAMIIGGILCSLMIKAVNNSLPDKEQVQFLKAFHTLEAVTANIINDKTRYDKNPKATENAFLSQDPLDTAEVTIGGTTYSSDNLGVNNAYCLFVAEQINTIGDVNCDSSYAGANFKTTNSGTFYGLSGNFENSDGVEYKDVTVSLSGSNGKYVIRVMSNGRLTIPDSTNASGVTSKNLCKEKYWYEHQSSTKNEAKKHCS